MLYLYAITNWRPRPSGDGLRGRPLRVVFADGLAATISEHAEELRFEEDDLWAHEEVVEDLMGGGPVLPVRIGSSLTSDDDVRATLRERRDEFDRALQRVRGAVELGVRATAADARLSGAASPPPGRSGSGTDYLMSRLGQQRRHEDIATRVHEPLARIARESVTRSGFAERGAIKAAYLVDTDRVEAFRGRVEELGRELDGASIVCTGPWPPYSFASSEQSG